MQRRDFLRILSAGTLLATAPALFASKKQPSTILYSAGSDLSGNYNISAYAVYNTVPTGKNTAAKNATTKPLFTVPLPARAHAVTLRESHNEIIVFARRPNDFMIVLDALTGEIKHTLRNNKPLFGHGVFTVDGNTLFTTENDFENKQGVIGVRDASNGYKKIAEFPSGGIGPHELHLLTDDKTLVVANGGILTHPDTGRAKLNIQTMSPALTYIDSQSSSVIDDYRLNKKHHKLSIRHLDVSKNDQVCFVMQYQGSRLHQVPLVGFHQGESQLQLAAIPKTVLPQMKNYCGSVTVDAAGETFAVSSPRGNLMTLWNSNAQFIDSFDLKDGCGIATGNEPNEFFFSNGGGDLHQHSSTDSTLLSNNHNQRWDNHLIAWNRT